MNIGIRKLFVCLLMVLASLPTPAQDESKDGHLFTVAKNLEVFNALYKELDMMYVDTLDADETIGHAINAMLSSLDPYTEYYPEDKQSELKMMLSGKYAGIGALIRQNLLIDRIVIDEPYENMPAAEAGLRKGDIILSIDDSTMVGKSVSYVSEHLRGDAGTTFVLKVLRPSGEGVRGRGSEGAKERGAKIHGKEMKFKITRRNIKLPELPYYGMRPDSIGYINLNQFTEGCAKEVRRAFIDLKKRGAKALVFDLRSNGGGSELEAVDIVNLWVDKGQTIVENKGKISQANHSYTTRLEPVDTKMPLVVLVNGETASASEITSGALQDLDRAVVLGKILSEEQRRAITWDVERGAPNEIVPEAWQTCTCLGGWHWNEDISKNNRYKQAPQVVRLLIDVVSKNGNLLLSVPLRSDGTFDEHEHRILEDIKAWMQQNGEAIYATRPWVRFGEGPVAEADIKMNAQGFNEGSYARMGADEVRFTQTRKALYAIPLGWPEGGRVCIRSLRKGNPDYKKKIKHVELLGYGRLKAEQSAEGLTVVLPSAPVNGIAPVLKIRK